MIVSSGAVALGRRLLGFANGSLRLEQSQAAAAVGQIHLAHAYMETLAAKGLVAAQILLTFEDTEVRRRYLNAHATLRTLLRCGTIPIINENDTVATAEIRFGDNDRLAARAAAMMSAEKLILLSDVDGLYSADPTRDDTGQHFSEVARITPEIEAMAGGSRSGVGRGGMASKILAARLATSAGCEVIVASGKAKHPIAAIRAGARSTRFTTESAPGAARKTWIGCGLKVAGALIIDEGATRAIRRGKSLLPAGVKFARGDFSRGDAISIQDLSGREVARGLAAYNAADVTKIIGKKSSEAALILGFRGRQEVVHRDDLAIRGVQQ